MNQKLYDYLLKIRKIENLIISHPFLIKFAKNYIMFNKL